MMALLDNLSVWDVESDGGWKEMARLGLCLLIQYASQPDLEVKPPLLSSDKQAALCIQVVKKFLTMIHLYVHV